uniref:guanylate cyclase n=1 Tax=Globodera rostochiensis TaxID=31243 RepID=A0A914H1A6_GLORO
MFGWVHESFRQLVTRKHGKEIWTKILEIAKFEEGTENEISKYYKDEESFRLVSAMGSVIGIPVEEVWEAYGGFLIQFTMETGWDELLRALSPDLEGFLDALDALHYFIDHVVYRTKLKGPAFRCEPQPDGSLILHYYSRRSGLYPIVKEVARRIYDTEVIMQVQERKQEHVDSMITEHVTFVISQVENNMSVSRSIASRTPLNTCISSIESSSSVNSTRIEDFCVAFPHHFCFDRQLRIEHVGAHIRRAYPNIVHGETHLEDILTLVHPEIPLSFDTIMTFRNSLFVFQLRDESSKGDSKPNSVRSVESRGHIPVTLKGSMHSVSSNKYMLFMCSLNVTTVHELVERNLFLSDIQRHDSTRDLIMLNQSRMSQVELNRRLEETTRTLKSMASALKAEKQRTEELLCELMPPSVAESLRQGTTVEAAEFPDATVLFTDIVTFTNICSYCTPYDVINLLNDLYQRFDRIVGLHDVYKVETIGDAYMIVGGVPKECRNHAEKILNVAIGFLMESRFVANPTTKLSIFIRIGVHSGSVVAGVVGVKMPRYCLFGDTIHLANRMESLGVPSKMHVSETARALAVKSNPSFLFTERGTIKIKGKEMFRTYFLERNDRKSVWEICGRVRTISQSIDGYQELHGEKTSECEESEEADGKGKKKQNENAERDAGDGGSGKAGATNEEEWNKIEGDIGDDNVERKKKSEKNESNGQIAAKARSKACSVM